MYEEKVMCDGSSECMNERRGKGRKGTKKEKYSPNVGLGRSDISLSCIYRLHPTQQAPPAICNPVRRIFMDNLIWYGTAVRYFGMDIAISIMKSSDLEIYWKWLTRKLEIGNPNGNPK